MAQDQPCRNLVIAKAVMLMAMIINEYLFNPVATDKTGFGQTILEVPENRIWNEWKNSEWKNTEWKKKIKNNKKKMNSICGRGRKENGYLKRILALAPWQASCNYISSGAGYEKSIRP